MIVTLAIGAFGSKASTGILLPLFVLGDILAVIFYNQNVQWKHLKEILPLMSLGVLIGVFMGRSFSHEWFNWASLTTIFVGVSALTWRESQKSPDVPSNKWFSGAMGLLAGIVSMLGNLAGPLSMVYFLAVRLPKSQFIGTTAWLFLFINIFKLPFHLLVWETIDTRTLKLDSVLLLSAIFGFVIGIKLVGRMSNKTYRILVLIATFAGVITMFVKQLLL